MGEVMQYKENEFYHIIYKDGDKEDLNQNEMEGVVVVKKKECVGTLTRKTKQKKKESSSKTEKFDLLEGWKIASKK